jgi:hypothetical protein
MMMLLTCCVVDLTNAWMRASGGAARRGPWIAFAGLDGITLDGDQVNKKGAFTGGFIDTRKSRIDAHKRSKVSMHIPLIRLSILSFILSPRVD